MKVLEFLAVKTDDAQEWSVIGVSWLITIIMLEYGKTLLISKSLARMSSAVFDP